jgi:hypothetical protein
MATALKLIHVTLLGLALPSQAFALAPTTAERDLAAGVELQASSEETLEDHGPPLLFESDVAVGGYGGLDVAYTRMFGRDGAVVGVQGALVLNHRLSLGLAGYGWTNAPPGPNDGDGQAQSYDMGYGGVTVRYSFYMQNLPVYLTAGALIGGGGIALTPDDLRDFEERDDNPRDDVFALVQPDLTLNANLTSWMRLGVTAGYRLTTGVGRSGFSESDVNGWLVGGQVQFGSF